MATQVSQSNNRSVSFGYGDQLIHWLEDEGFGSNRYLKSVFQSNADDQTKYLFALAFYDSLSGKSGGHKADPGDEMAYLVPYEKPDGSFHYVNKMTGRIEVMVDRMSNGLFSYYGPKKYMEILGGRGSLSGIVDRMADGKYFNKN